MLYKSLGLLALAAVSSAQSGGFYGNSTGTPTGTGSPTLPTGTGSPTLPTGEAPYPAIVAGWEYVGCAAPPASSGFPGYRLAGKSQNLTAESCATSCSSSVFFGLSGDSCFCSNGIQNGTTIRPDSQCNTKCPGNKAQACGHSGLSDHSPLGRRQVSQVGNGGQLLSLYRKDIVPVGDIYIDIVVIIYVDVCPTGLTTVTYCEVVTMTGCGCTEKTPPPVPMTTTTTICTACGPGTKTVTLTIPTGACTTKTVGPPIVPKPTSKPCEGPSCPKPCEGPSCPKPCEGPSCPKPCEGPSCPKPCEGPSCPKPCEGPSCPKPCEGPSCPKPCEGPSCPKPCEGPSCPKPCEGPSCPKPCEGPSCTATGTGACTGPACSATATNPIKPIFTGGAVARGFSGGLAVAAGVIALL